MRFQRLCFSAAVATALSLSVQASNLFTNPGFETGDLTGWTVASTQGSDDGFYADNTTTTPLNGFPTVGPFAGNWYAVTDMSGLVTPETTTLTQSVTIPIGTTAVSISLEMFVNDQFGSSGTGAEVAIWANGANTLTAAPLFVLFGPIDTAVSGGTPNPYVLYQADITGDVTAGTTYTIGVLESDANGPINVGVDNFAVTATSGIPEPGTMGLTGLFAAAVLAYGARRKARA
jgi:hypothetical protein